MPNMKDFEKRIESEARSITPIRMEYLVCKDCFHRGGRMDMCGVFPNVKPGKIFHGEDCPYYRKK